jgi:hypothetical protein
MRPGGQQTLVCLALRIGRIANCAAWSKRITRIRLLHMFRKNLNEGK